MSSFATAYLLVWGAVVVYVARLGARQRRIAAALKELESRTGQASGPRAPSRAA